MRCLKVWLCWFQDCISFTRFRLSSTHYEYLRVILKIRCCSCDIIIITCSSEMPPDQLQCAFHQHQAGTSLFPFLSVCREGKGEQTMSSAIQNWTVCTCVSVPTWLSCTTVGSHGTEHIVSHTSVFFKPTSPQQQTLGFSDLLCPYLCLIGEGKDFPPLAGEHLGGVSYSISSEARPAEHALGRQQTSGLRRTSQCY